MQRCMVTHVITCMRCLKEGSVTTWTRWRAGASPTTPPLPCHPRLAWPSTMTLIAHAPRRRASRLPASARCSSAMSARRRRRCSRRRSRSRPRRVRAVTGAGARGRAPRSRSSAPRRRPAPARARPGRAARRRPRRRAPPARTARLERWTTPTFRRSARAVPAAARSVSWMSHNVCLSLHMAVCGRWRTCPNTILPYTLAARRQAGAEGGGAGRAPRRAAPR